MLDLYPTHQKALDHLMKYFVDTKNCGLVLSPMRLWDGNKDFKFCIHGQSDSDYATNEDNQNLAAAYF